MTACFHCELPVLEPGRHRADILGAPREFCCAGCEAVASTIAASGLEQYYETRSAPAASPVREELERFGAEDFKGDEASLILDRVRCAACLWLIEQRLRLTPGVTRAHVNYATQRAQLAWDPRKTSLSSIIRSIRAVGYDAYPYDPRRQDAVERREHRAALWRLFVAAFGAMQVMMYAFPAYVGEVPQENMQLMRWASLLLTLPVLVFSCRPFFDGAWRELRYGRIGLDTPIALGLAGGFAASAWATLAGSGEVYFDSISMLAFLLLGARYLEAAARRRAARALDPLLKWVSGNRLSVGEALTVAPGERIPADGVVEEGASSVDESLLTGESRPIAKRAGDALAAGSVNLDQPLAMRATRVGADTQAAAIARLAERAAASKPRLVEAADRVARHLTFVVIAVAALAFFYSGDYWIAVAVLVATCPCALALAAPVVLTRASAALLGRGALLTRARALEALERVTDVVLDKTGTLTAGRVAVARFVALGRLGEARCFALARALEASSRHPIARAFGAGEQASASRLRNVPGRGIEGRIDGGRVRIGAEGFCRELCGSPLSGPPDEACFTRVYLADEQGWLAAFELADPLRPGAAELIAGLQARGIAVHLASGDDPRVAASAARTLGIGAAAGGMTPQDKHDYLARLQGKGRVVAMIGDGLNDAPVLARADVSFAMGSGADAAQLQADVVVLGNSLNSILETFNLARRTMRLVRQNLGWALAYNAAVLPLAALGGIGPWEAALGMGASSLVVALNALRPLVPGEPWKASTFSSRSPSASYS